MSWAMMAMGCCSDCGCLGRRWWLRVAVIMVIYGFDYLGQHPLSISIPKTSKKCCLHFDLHFCIGLQHKNFSIRCNISQINWKILKFDHRSSKS
ncbi:hypothetical protein Pfo_007899 [Paulownia fortunei]|nr:hypothetical protein Pfo_007899 [Paulownia fortunei]